MKYKPFVDGVEEHAHMYVYGGDQKKDFPKDMTLGMPFNEYNELLLDLMNQANYIMTPGNTVGIIKHFVVHGISVHIYESEGVTWGIGELKDDQKFFERLDFEPLAHQKKQTPLIQMQTLGHRA